ncbi:MAG: tyrosine-type recombinase/integrase [Xanthomarina gelatinilytica]|uniref:tyrosine-type recombinase/integrase n=1 Tax=Xanthomarina gelatinilytica TaxID=1137281 RepID=UPI003A892C0B
MKTTITLKPLFHKNLQCIAIGFKFNDTVRLFVKQFQGVLWSNQHKTFYIGYSSETLSNLFDYFNKAGYYVDYSAMKQIKHRPTQKKLKPTPPDKVALYQELPTSHKGILKAYVNYLNGKRLSHSTVNIYSYFVLRFLNYAKDIKKTEWQTRHMELFIETVIVKEQYSISSHRQTVSSLKHLTVLCGIEKFDATHFERPKKSRYLPVVLSKEAIIELIRVTKNLKHRLVIAFLYSSGLRIGELLELKLPEIDLERSQIIVLQGKGRKDRVVSMSEAIKPLLLNYLNTYRPSYYLIEGRDGGKYSDVSVRFFLKQSCKLAGIKKKVTPHTLRHSYATHMLENGVDLRYIQELLGHSKPETTMIYTHVAQKDILQISNPLDVAVKDYLESAKNHKKVLLPGK